MSRSPDTPAPRLLYQADSFFNDLYDQGLQVTGTPEAKRRRERFYNLVQLFLLSLDLEGRVAECGCWRGLSSFILCHYLKQQKPSFRGAGYHIFDSFQGLSKPTSVDSLSDSLIAELTRKFGSSEGAFAASLADVKSALGEFPEIDYHAGWIPPVFKNLAEDRYRFVHVDLDLYEPTLASLEYFYPRLVNGGLIVCDDYGSLLWPGAKQAVDSFCIQGDVSFIRISTGQAVIWKRGAVENARPSRDVASLRRSLVDVQMELNRSRAEMASAEQRARDAHVALNNERDELKARIHQLSTRFSEVKTEARTKLEKLRANLVQILKDRDERKAKGRDLARRLAETEARMKELETKLRSTEERAQRFESDNEDVRKMLLQVREERNRAKARALDFARRLAELKEQLRQHGESDRGGLRPD